MEKTYAVGVDIGGTNSRVGMVDEKYNVICETKIATNANDFEETINSIFAIINEMRKKHNVVKIGVACPGPMDLKSGLLLNSPNLPNWRHKNVLKIFVDQYPNCAVRFENDANAAAYGQYLLHNCRKNVASLLFFTMSTGVGCGFVNEGKIFIGAGGFATEIANVIVDSTNNENEETNSENLISNGIESFCGGNGIVHQFNKRGIMISSTKEAFDLYGAQNKVACQILDANKKRLAKLFAAAIAFLNPQVICVGGPIAQNNKEYFRSIFRITDDYLFTCVRGFTKFEFAIDGDWPALIGAAMM